MKGSQVRHNCQLPFCNSRYTAPFKTSPHPTPHRPLWLGHSLVPQLHPHPSHQCHSREHLHIPHLRRKQSIKSWQISSLLHQRFNRWRTLGQFTRGGETLYPILYIGQRLGPTSVTVYLGQCEKLNLIKSVLKFQMYNYSYCMYTLCECMIVQRNSLCTSVSGCMFMLCGMYISIPEFSLSEPTRMQRTMETVYAGFTAEGGVTGNY